jgi:hypothetical protein
MPTDHIYVQLTFQTIFLGIYNTLVATDDQVWESAIVHFIQVV